MTLWQSIKYVLIILKSELTGKTVVTFFGVSYAVAGNVVKRLGK